MVALGLGARRARGGAIGRAIADLLAQSGEYDSDGGGGAHVEQRICRGKRDDASPPAVGAAAGRRQDIYFIMSASFGHVRFSTGVSNSL